MPKAKNNRIEFRECCFRTVPKEGKKLVWEITHSCKFKCDYCFQEKKRLLNPIRVLNNKDLILACEKFKEFNVKEVLITGGEIFFAKDVIDVICGCLRDECISFSFSTNMTSKKDFVDFLLNLGPRALNISFDLPSGFGDIRKKWPNKLWMQNTF